MVSTEVGRGTDEEAVTARLVFESSCDAASSAASLSPLSVSWKFEISRYMSLVMTDRQAIFCLGGFFHSGFVLAKAT
eukprot:CAMPEP_0174941188 /NCGR_PEP_ID=MMETSP1355-20121228/71067_2 /TAXON_ID=464990 /ORGANISM="Hemiselmis tepida, Strain CCMP443" /LENGTH=76 /DNA_ID=CAMNT_0016188275 /DNA_START=133 /DNA_END=359 /DNA_ORIENTATION=-